MSTLARVIAVAAISTACASACSGSETADNAGGASGASAAGGSDAGAPADASGGDSSGWPSGTKNLAEFVEQSVPPSASAGQPLAASITMRNTGTTTWSAASSYFLGSTNPQDNVVWGTKRGAMADGVQTPPGTSYTFTLNLVSPTTAGDYSMTWQMVQEGVEWFGESSPAKTVTVGGTGLGPIDLKSVVLHDSLDVSDWAVTKNITGVELSDVDGVRLTLTPYDPNLNADAWPDFEMWPPDTLRYTLWLFVPLNGKWHGAAVLEYWADRDWSGAPLLKSYGDWIYPNPASPWGEMADYVPKEGDEIGFMATAGDLRRSKNVLSVMERSNVVTVKLVPNAVYTLP